MAASNTDLVRNATPNFATTLANSMLVSDTSMSLSSATGLPTATAITLVIDATDPVSGASTPTLKEVVTGTLSGTTVSNLVRGLDGTTAQGHSSGANVVMWITANLWNDWQTSYLSQHTQSGTHGAITATSLSASSGLTMTGGTFALTGLYDGWVAASDTWTYVSADATNATYTFKITGVDRTSIMNIGDRIKLTQTTVKYFIVTGLSFSTDTTVTIYGGTTYSLANATISANYYSHMKGPAGFPLDPTKWTVVATSSNDRNITTTSFGSLTDTFTVPIGAWKLSLKASVWGDVQATTTRQGIVTLSSDASTETNPKISIGVQLQGNSTASTISYGSQGRTEDDINVSSATTFTLMGKISSTTSTSFSVLGSSVTPTIFKAVCAYL